MRALIAALLVLAHVLWPRPARAESPPIYLYGTACIHAVVYNDAVPDAATTVQQAVAWWRERAPATQFAALITVEARHIHDLRANDGRVWWWYYGVRPGEDWTPQARAANAERQRQHGCATSWAVFFTPTREVSWAMIYGPLAFVATDNPLTTPEALLTHEIGHIYGALDQRQAARTACTERSGVLQVETQNSSQPGCLLAVDSIMKNSRYSYPRGLVDHYALGQIGAWDSDGDGLTDPRDPTPYPVLLLPIVTHF